METALDGHGGSVRNAELKETPHGLKPNGSPAIESNVVPLYTLIPYPLNSTKKYIINRKYLPISSKNGNHYTLSIWIWLQEIDYNNNKQKWKHILHIGDSKATKCQPSIWLDPNINKLVIFFDTIDKKYIYDPIIENKMYKSYNETLRKSDSFEVFNYKRLSDLKEDCNNNINCKSISLECKNNSNNSICKYGILSLKNHHDKNFFTLNNQQIEKSKNDKMNYIGTINKNESHTSTNPNKNLKIFEEDFKKGIIENIPIGRWFHLALVVENQSAIIYIDGKLKQTIVFQSPIRMNDGHIYLTNDGGYKGLLSQLKYYNNPLFYKEINKIYNQGPKPWTFPLNEVNYKNNKN